MTARTALWLRWTVATTIAWGAALVLLGVFGVAASWVSWKRMTMGWPTVGMPSVRYEGGEPVVWYVMSDRTQSGLWRAAGPVLVPRRLDTGTEHSFDPPVLARAGGAFLIDVDGIVRVGSGFREVVAPRPRRFQTFAVSTDGDVALGVDVADRELQVLERREGVWSSIPADYGDFPAPMRIMGPGNLTHAGAPVIERVDGVLRVAYFVPGRGLVVVEYVDGTWRIVVDEPAGCPPCAISTGSSGTWLLALSPLTLTHFDDGHAEVVIQLDGWTTVDDTSLSMTSTRAYAVVAGTRGAQTAVVAYDIDVRTREITQQFLGSEGAVCHGGIAIGEGNDVAIALREAEDLYPAPRQRIVLHERRDGQWKATCIEDASREERMLLVAEALLRPTFPGELPPAIPVAFAPPTLMALALMATGQAYVLRRRSSRPWRFVPLTLAGWLSGRLLWYVSGQYAIGAPDVVPLVAHLEGVALLATALAIFQGAALRELGVRRLPWGLCTAAGMAIAMVSNAVLERTLLGWLLAPSPLTLSIGPLLAWTWFGPILGGVTGIPLARACEAADDVL